jgi:hypothetical protein
MGGIKRDGKFCFPLMKAVSGDENYQICENIALFLPSIKSLAWEGEATAKFPR